MRFLMMVKGNADYENGKPPSAALMEGMARLTAEMTQAGKLLSAEGLLPTRFGAARVTVAGGKRTVVDGPFAETKEQFLGFFLVDMETLDAAIDFARELAVANPGVGAYEIRPLRVFKPGGALEAL